MYQTYLFDLDGTVFLGEQPIPAAIDFINRLKARQISCYFITNNSTKAPEVVAAKLRRMGIAVENDHIITSAVATAAYIAAHYSYAKVLVIGEAGLVEALENAGIMVGDEGNVDVVVAGLDSQFTYEKLAQAQRAILQGAVFIGTNGDVRLPHEGGYLPGAGSVLAAITAASGVEPLLIGKPEPPILAYACERFHLDKTTTVLVGDNYDTDILGGIRFGIDTILVETGVHKRTDIADNKLQPTYILESLVDADSL